MSKNTKRLIGIAIAAVLTVALCVAGFVMATAPDEDPVCYIHGDVNGDGKINKDDAIYLLYASFPGMEDEFPMTQDGKIDSNDVTDKDDAIYLLYASFEVEKEDAEKEFPLKGAVHSYYDPTWVWNEDARTAMVTFKCGCSPLGHEVEAEVTVVSEEAATCVKAGSCVLSAKAVYDGKEYTTEENKTIVLPATGEHALNQASCTVDLACANCDYMVAAPGHSFALDNKEEPTCTAEGVEHYKCANCPETVDVTLDKVGHTLTYLEGQDRATDDPCEFVKQYSCSECRGVFNGTGADDTYVKHTFVTKLTTEATCRADGEMTTACSQCGEVKETVKVDRDESKHVWDEGDTSVVGKITFTCMTCGGTKEEIVADQGKVATSALTSGTGVNLGEKTSVAMDDKALESLGTQQITISVEQKAKTEIEGLSKEKADQIPSNTVYDFTMKDENGKTVDNFGGGLITVTLPYELQDGDDINSIDIWYIDNAGQPTRVEGAVYSNGYVTFQTGHFSYYTVTRLTPAERCQRLGTHILIHQTKAATCTEDGYDMTVCQRCGEVTEMTVYNKTGHKYTNSEKAATCTNAGLLTQTCGCGHVVTKTLPALGHTMELDTEKTKAPTCSAAGKTVMVCSRNCGYTTEEPIPQRAHDYKVSAEKSQAATCSAAGYEIHVCSLCGDEVRKNETAPLGHSYPEEKAVWNWTDDSTAKVTLVCFNDENHTKVLDAVVTKDDEKSQNTSCLGSGSIVYEASVGYNGKTYTKYNEITVDAPGHKYGTAWETSAGQHYHLCTVCSEKLDAEAHTWVDGEVTKEATCVDAGSKTVSCSVCGYEKTEVISATGEHSYVNGACSQCGVKEGNCRHLPIYKSEVDNEALGICDGTKIVKYSCECGQEVEYELVAIGCEFGESKETETKDEYGFTTYENTSVCAVCGLVAKDGGRYEVDAQKCYREYHYYEALYMGSTTAYYRERMTYGNYHPGVTVTDTVTVEHEGLCDDITITFKQCICGKYETYSMGGGCQWGWAVDGIESNTSLGMCYECGAEQKILHSSSEVEGQTCMRKQIDVITISYGKQDLYSFQDTYEYESHDTHLTGHEKLGDSCEDGVVYRYACTKCGQSEESFSREHEPVKEEWIDLSQYNTCSDSLIQLTCVCDAQYMQCQLSNDGGSGCELEWAWDKDTQEEFWMCYECGLKRYENTTYSDKDENCECILNRTYTYKNAEGETIATGLQRNASTNHSMKTEAKLIEGAESCEDGLIVRNYCTDCSYEYSYEENYHDQQLIATYDLSAFDGCIEEVYLYECPCGESSHVEWDNYCQQQWVDGNENQEVWKCDVCGMLETIDYSYPENDDPCVNHVIQVYTYSKEGVETTVRFTSERFTQNHDHVFELTLNAGATSCEQGYRGVGTCRICGDVTQTGLMYWHNTYTVASEQVDGGKMCGTVLRRTNSCACGQNSSTSIRWDEENRCEFMQSKFSEELETWVYTCSGCGSYRYTLYTDSPVEGTTCQSRYENITRYFDEDGNALFETVTSGTSYSHNYVSTFLNPDGTPWSGTDCAQGYRISRTCSKCGETSQDPAVYTFCQNWGLGSEYLHDGTDICGPIYITRSGCPCGNESYANLTDSCDWEHTGWNAEGDEIQRCSVCGLVRHYAYEEKLVEATCQVEIIRSAVYYMNDQLLCQGSASYMSSRHLWVYSYNNVPQSCEDGWSATSSCFRCGEFGGSESGNSHMRNTTAYYDLSRYGMCDGYLRAYSCACGENAGWNFEEGQCSWSHLGADQNGTITYRCDKCNTYSYRTEKGELGEGCMYTGTERVQFVRNGETVLDVTLAEGGLRHSERVVSASLMTPGTSCEDGIYLTWQCRNCDWSYVSQDNYHYEIESDRVETACGSEFVRYACLCGEEAYTSESISCSWSTDEYDSEGDRQEGSGVAHKVCRRCGLEYAREESWALEENTCTGTRTGTTTLTYGDQVYALTFKTNYTEHLWSETVYTLKGGATTCEGNLTATQTCELCGVTSTWYPGSGHYVNKVATLELKSYGATCGGELYKYQCPCGATGRYDISEDTLCKLQQQGTELWIENALNDAYAVSTDTSTWIYSRAWTFTCAVTEPACSLKLRMAEYWLDEGCVATEYQTWQYFDASLNTWVQMDTVATGEQLSYHDYITTNVDTTEGDVKVTGTRRDCACGAYYYDLTYTNPDSTYVRTLEAADGDGVSRFTERSDRYEYLCYHNNCTFITKSYNEYSYRNGDDEWNQTVYTYNFDGTCEVKAVRTSSYNEPDEWTEEHIENLRHYTMEVSPTCTQSGVENWKINCKACNELMDSYTYAVDPWNHDWYSTGDGTYGCYRCGLENGNGASDGIILEDLTEKYGDGVNYVAGYWNKDKVTYVASVCVIVEGQEPIYLEGITPTEHETLTALCFNKALAHQLADAAVGDTAYELRLNLVTTQGERMEYAITFTNDAAQ